MTALYDTIGLNYADLRRPDSRIAAKIHAGLGKARTILNVGAGSGNYEPLEREVTAVEPSAKMIAQRTHPAHRVIQASAEDLPLEDASVDAVMASLTIHHWTDQPRAISELKRVCRGPKVFFTYDPTFNDHWLLDYFPENSEIDAKQFPEMADFDDWFDTVDVQTVPIPHDCTDGFFFAYWRRPGAYLNASVRAASSSFHRLPDVDTRIARLEDDLSSGAWLDRYGSLMHRETLDCGYRLVIAR
ncbi:MAG: class I SAM-dependent methyltransferase [Pseudomonadota bacterium]